MIVVELASTAEAEMSWFQALLAGKGTNPLRLAPAPVDGDEQLAVVVPVPSPFFDVLEEFLLERLQPDKSATDRRSALSLNMIIRREFALVAGLLQST